MNEQIIQSKIITYDSLKQVGKIINDNFLEDYLLVRHNQSENKLFFKKLPNTKFEV